MYERYVTNLPETRLDELGICIMLDSRYKAYDFVGATSTEKELVLMGLKAEFDEHWKLGVPLPILPSPTSVGLAGYA